MTALAQMAEIDLIPADYRSERAMLRQLRRAGIVLLALICVAATLGAGLRHATGVVRDEVMRLGAAAAAVELERSGIAGLTQRKAVLETELLQLRSLRSGTVITDSLQTVDRALSGGGQLWLLEWRFERLGAELPTATQGAAGNPPAARVQMTMIGQARHHAAVSDFVRSLLAQPGVEDVRILRTSRDGDAGEVDFELLAVAGDGGAR